MAEVIGDDGIEFSILSCSGIKEVVFQVLSRVQGEGILRLVREHLEGIVLKQDEKERMLELVRFEVDEQVSSFDLQSSIDTSLAHLVLYLVCNLFPVILPALELKLQRSVLHLPFS